jgi:Purple acid Phosphatase, N-terminal domain/Calcineurin-like phosphoesterase
VIRHLVATTLVATATGLLVGVSPAGAFELRVTPTPDRSGTVPLEGAVLAGERYIVAVPDAGATRVRFYLDDPGRARNPIKLENNPPWDFAGSAPNGTPLPYDTTRLSDGSHNITAAIEKTGGGTDVITATFAVQNSVPQPPDQVHLAWVGDPSTTFTVAWRTRATINPSTVEYRETGTSEWLTTEGGPRPSGTVGVLRQATVTGLRPSTAYEYRVRGDGDMWSDTFTTRTAPPPGPADFDAVYFADTGLIGRTDGLATGTRQAVDEIAALRPLVALPGGDYAYFDTDKRFGTLERTIDAWFNQVQPIAASTPLMPTYGNHEVLLGEGFLPWSQRFPTPPGFDGQREYSFDIGEVHFVSITAVQETTALSPATVAWIEQDIAAANARGMRWVVPYFHVPPFADGFSHPSNLALRNQLGPLFERLGVKLVLTSHDQSYERTYPLRDMPAANTPTSRAKSCYLPDEGTTWVKTSPAGKLSNKNGNFSLFRTHPQQSYIAVRDDTRHHFTRLRFFSSGSFRVETFGFARDGAPLELVDSFTYSVGGCAPEFVFARDATAMSATRDGLAVTQTLQVDTSDGQSTSFTASDDASWLSIEPSDGQAPGQLTLRVDPQGLAQGAYDATVTVTAPGYAPATHSVKLTVIDPAEPHRLMVSASANRANPVPLAGRAVSGSIYVFVAPESNASRVRFWLDNPPMTGTPRRSENNPPWDFAGGTVATATPFNAASLTPGTHTISALIDLAGGGTERIHASFTR